MTDIRPLLELTVGEIVNEMYLDLKENGAENGDTSKLKFGTSKFEAVLEVEFKR